VHKTIAAVLIAAVPFTPGLSRRAESRAFATLPPSVVDTNPQSGLRVGTAFPQISARFSAAASIDPTSVRLMVDDIDVTNVATITSAYVSYVPVSQMRNGSHSVSVVARTLDGTPLGDTWTFLVQSDAVARYANPSWGYAPGPYGYPGYGFYPPGFALYAPGPIFFVAGGFVQVIFFSPFSPYGTGFVTIGGIPGVFFLTPWYGCPGYYWATIPVPFGVYANSAILSAHFTMPGGRTVIVHSTTPLQIDGTRRTLPATIRFANEPVFVIHPASPQAMVRFRRVVPRAGMSVVPGAGANNFNEPGFIAPRVVVPVKPTKPVTPVLPGVGGNASGFTRIAPSDPVRIMESNQRSLGTSPGLLTGQSSVITSSNSTGIAPYSIGPYSMPIAPYSVPPAPFSTRVSPIAMPGTRVPSTRVQQGITAQR